MGRRSNERIGVERLVGVVTRRGWRTEGRSRCDVGSTRRKVTAASESRRASSSARCSMSSTSTTGRLVLVCTAEIIGVEDALVVCRCCRTFRSLEEYCIFFVRVVYRFAIRYVAGLWPLSRFGCARRSSRLCL
jgi:hypothetical protein